MHDAAICVLKVESASETGIMKPVLEKKLEILVLVLIHLNFGIHTKTLLTQYLSLAI